MAGEHGNRFQTNVKLYPTSDGLPRFSLSYVFDQKSASAAYTWSFFPIFSSSEHPCFRCCFIMVMLILSPLTLIFQIQMLWFYSFFTMFFPISFLPFLLFSQFAFLFFLRVLSSHKHIVFLYALCFIQFRVISFDFYS